MDKLVVRKTRELHGIYYSGDERELVYGKDFEKLLRAIRKNRSDIQKLRVRNNDIEFIFKDILVVLDNKDNFKDDDRFDYLFNMLRKKKYKLNRIRISTIAIGLSLVSAFSVNANLNKKAEEKVDTKPTTSSYDDYNYDIEKELQDFEVQNAKPTKPSDEYEDEEKTITEDDIKNKLSIPSNFERSKLEKTKRLYYDLICKYSKLYGLDPDLMCAIATQESGVHSNELSRYGNGLFQIEGVHIGETLRPYNYETNSNDVIHITSDNIVDLESNIQMGCAIYQDALKRFDGNILVALKAYNVGNGAMNNMINDYCYETNKTKEKVLQDKLGTGWDTYHTNKYGGDKEYIRHVLRYYDGSLTKLLLEKNNVIVKS